MFLVKKTLRIIFFFDGVLNALKLKQRNLFRLIEDISHNNENISFEMSRNKFENKQKRFLV